MRIRPNLLASVALVAALRSPALADTTRTACTVPNAAASIVRMVPVDVPPIAQLQGLSGSTTLQVDVDERGVPHRPVVVASSGSAVLDDLARKAALAQSYAPQIQGLSERGVGDTTNLVWAIPRSDTTLSVGDNHVAGTLGGSRPQRGRYHASRGVGAQERSNVVLLQRSYANM